MNRFIVFGLQLFCLLLFSIGVHCHDLYLAKGPYAQCVHEVANATMCSSFDTAWGFFRPQVCELLGIKHNPYSAYAAARDKYATRQVLRCASHAALPCSEMSALF
jgi:adenylosuccinate lyase